MDGWTDRQRDGQTDTDGWTDRQTDTNRQTERQTDGQTDRQTDGWTDKHTDGQINQQKPDGWFVCLSVGLSVCLFMSLLLCPYICLFVYLPKKTKTSYYNMQLNVIHFTKLQDLTYTLCVSTSTPSDYIISPSTKVITAISSLELITQTTLSSSLNPKQQVQSNVRWKPRWQK